MYEEDDLLPISALQHLLYCERRLALVHVEQAWAENAFTVEGKHLHERTDEVSERTRGEMLVSRGLAVRSFRLGLFGKVDTVEWVPAPSSPGSEHIAHGCGTESEQAASRDGVRRYPVIVEYKRGRLRKEEGYEVQLCAQALCIEEMLGVHVDFGTIFYGENRRRLVVRFENSLRLRTEDSAQRLREIVCSGVTPSPRKDARCRKCSLVDVCKPGWVGSRSVKRYLSQFLSEQEG